MVSLVALLAAWADALRPVLVTTAHLLQVGRFLAHSLCSLQHPRAFQQGMMEAGQAVVVWEVVAMAEEILGVAMGTEMAVVGEMAEREAVGRPVSKGEWGGLHYRSQNGSLPQSMHRHRAQARCA